MKNFFIKLIIIIQCFSLFFTIILKTIFSISFNFSFYEKFYKENNIAKSIGTNYEDLLANTKNLLNYIKGYNNLNANWFTSSDIDHMVDVKNLYIYANNFMYFSFAIFVICSFITIILLKKETLNYISNIFNKVLLLFFIIILALAIFVAKNFNTFWIKFHQTIFSNDLWLLDPTTSILIQMVPEQFFIALVSKIIIYVLIAFLLLFVLNTIYKITKKKKFLA